MDLTIFADEELDQHRIDVLKEQERRANLAQIPEQIEQLAKTYRDGGGDERVLQGALTPEQIAAIED